MTAFRHIWGALRQRVAAVRFPLPLGRRAERYAARYLRRRGYRILARNWRNRFGEIDLIAQAPGSRIIVIVEVKAGRGGSIAPEVHVNRDKQRKLIGLASQVAKRFDLRDRPFRFDVVGIDWPDNGQPTVRHHVGAFESNL